MCASVGLCVCVCLCFCESTFSLWYNGWFASSVNVKCVPNHINSTTKGTHKHPQTNKQTVENRVFCFPFSLFSCFFFCCWISNQTSIDIHTVATAAAAAVRAQYRLPIAFWERNDYIIFGNLIHEDSWCVIRIHIWLVVGSFTRYR